MYDVQFFSFRNLYSFYQSRFWFDNSISISLYFYFCLYVSLSPMCANKYVFSHPFSFCIKVKVERVSEKEREREREREKVGGTERSR